MGLFDFFRGTPDKKKQEKEKLRGHIHAIEDFFVVGQTDDVQRAIAGKSDSELKRAAVDIACQLWGKDDVMAWITARNKLISFGACDPLDDKAALNWVKRNFNANKYKSFLVKGGRFSGIGKVILVIGLNIDPDKFGT
jgi:DNA polymerase III delta subunit